MKNHLPAQILLVCSLFDMNPFIRHRGSRAAVGNLNALHYWLFAVRNHWLPVNYCQKLSIMWKAFPFSTTIWLFCLNDLNYEIVCAQCVQIDLYRIISKEWFPPSPVIVPNRTINKISDRGGKTPKVATQIWIFIQDSWMARQYVQLLYLCCSVRWRAVAQLPYHNFCIYNFSFIMTNKLINKKGKSTFSINIKSNVMHQFLVNDTVDDNDMFEFIYS